MIPHRDEILRPAVSTDATAVPRYNLVRSDGTIIEKNVAMRLSNPVAREGTPISKAALDEMLAASGVTAGTATAYTLAQEEYTLFDGAPVRFRLHTASGDGATLNVNGTGAMPLRDMMGAAMPGGIPAGTWLTAYYSAAAGAYVLAGGEAVRALYGERYTVDDTVAYTKDVPADVLTHAEVAEVGGMTYKVNVGTEAAPVYELRSAPTTEVESVGVNLFDKSKCKNVTETDTGFSFAWTGTNSAPNSLGILKDVCPALRVGDVVYMNGSSVNSPSGSGKAFFYLAGESINWNGRAVTVTEKVLNGNIFAYGETGKLCEYKDVVITKIANAPYTPYQRHTLPIPEAVQALDGYGWGINDSCYNYIDCKKKQFVKRVGRVDMGTLGWAYDGNIFYAQVPNMRGDANVLCASYREAESVYDFLNNSPAILAYYSSWENAVNVKDTAYTDIATFKAAMSGVMLYYELATPIITDISDILPADNIIGVQPGGTITPVNEYNYAVPTTITYQRDVLANRASIFALEKLRLAMELLAKADLSNVSGTFGGVVKANAAAVSALGTAQVRNVTISAVDLTAGSSALATGDSYHVYA